MSINTPEDSVCDYLAELLYEGNLNEQASEHTDTQTQAAEAGPAIAKPVVPVAATATQSPSRAGDKRPAYKGAPSTTAPRQQKATGERLEAPVTCSVSRPALPVEPQGTKIQSPLPDKSPELAARVQRTAEPAPLAGEDVASVDRDKLTRLLNTARPTVAVEPAVVAKAAAPSLSPVAPVVEKPPAKDNSTTLATPLDPYSEIAWLENGRPAWAQERFDVLLFKVYGLTLAVPLIALGQIQPITEELTPIFGQAKWFMGLQPTPMGQIKTVNTALFVMPERYNPEFLETAKYVVSIDGLEWGLAVDSVQQPKSLDPDDVKWRTARGQRPWLAGTIKAHMCALIDVANMGRMLAASDRNRKQ